MQGNITNPNTKGSLDDDMLIVSSSPHLRTDDSTRKIMLDVVIAMLPAMVGAIYFFGINALKLIVIAVISSVAFEYIIQKIFKRDPTIDDFSAVVTGMLIAFNIPASAPWWIPIIASLFAIVIVKQFFGGIGQNFMNPALAARAFLSASWPVVMSNYPLPGPDAITGATPLSIMKYGGGELPTIMDMFLGNIGGSLGETSTLLLTIGGLYLIIRKVIDWKTPVIFIGTTAIMLTLLGVGTSELPYHIFGGGLILGAFYMLTDYSSTPVTPWGKVIVAIGAGILTATIRIKGGFPEGVSYAILLMNVSGPLIEKFTGPRIFGRSK